MRVVSIRLVLLLLIAIFISACGGEESAPPPPEPTATTVPPTNTPQPTPVPPTATPEPTATAEPTAVPDEPAEADKSDDKGSDEPAAEEEMEEDAAVVEAPIEVPADFETYFSEINGVTISYPSDWAIDDTFGLFIGSNQAIIDEGPEAMTGAVMAVIAQPTEELLGDSPLEQLEELTEFFAPDFLEDEAFDGPREIEVQGQPAAIARYRGEAENGTAVVAFLATISNGDNSVLILAVTFEEEEETYIDTLDTMLESIVLSEVMFDDVAIDESSFIEDRESAGDAISAALNESYEVTVPGGSFQEFTLDNLDQQPVSIEVIPAGSESDAAFEIYDVADLEFPIRSIDSSVSGESELFVFVPGGESSIVVRVYEFFDNEATFTVNIVGVAIDSRAVALGERLKGDLSSTTLTEYVFENASDAPILITADPLGAEIDLVVEIYEDGGEFLIDRIDSTLSSEAEQTVYTPFDGDTFIVRVTEFSGQSGSYEIAFEEIDLETLTVAVGDSVAGEIPAGAYQDYAIELTAGQEISVQAVPGSDDLDLVVEVYDSEDPTFWIDYVDDTFSGEDEMLPFVAPDAGTYIIRILDFTDAGGSFELTVLDGN